MNRIAKSQKEIQVQTLIRSWLEQFSYCINQCDYAQAETLFSPYVVGFGVNVCAALGVKALREKQWEQRWPESENFKFIGDTVKALVGTPYVVCSAIWFADSVNGSKLHGRCTLVFGPKAALKIKNSDPTVDGLLCFHSHFSEAPE